MLRPAPDCCVPSCASWLHTPLRPLPRAQALLWVPPSNPLNTYRLTITFLIALPGFKVRVAAKDGVRCERHLCSGGGGWSS